MDEEELLALRYYDDGVPSTNPNGFFRTVTQNHRWGKHYQSFSKQCPVCKRKQERQCEQCQNPNDPVPHTASINCQSGGRAHCTCDTCF